MQELFTTEFPSQGSSDLWGFNLGLAMVLAFIIVPVGLAALVVIAGAVGRLLSAMTRAQSNPGPVTTRFDLSRGIGSRIRFDVRRRTFARLEFNTRRPSHQRRRLTVQRPRDPQRWRRF